MIAGDKKIVSSLSRRPFYCSHKQVIARRLEASFKRSVGRMPSVPRRLRTRLHGKTYRCPAAVRIDVSAPAMTRRPSQTKPRDAAAAAGGPHVALKENEEPDAVRVSPPVGRDMSGRLGVDLYAQQIGSRLEDVTSFAKYLGGSSGNIAANTARLGLKSAMLTRVGDDQMGRFLTETLAKEGCDVSHVVKDPERLTALVLLGLKDRDTFPLVFYRENCADMALDAADFDEAFIASSRALLITGTHFSTAQVNETSRRAWTMLAATMCARFWISTIGRCSGVSRARPRARCATFRVKG